MREPIRDKERLEHIREAIVKLESGVAAHAGDITENSLEYFGIVKLIEIIGEAVYKLTKEFKDSHPATPWLQIERMRHVLVHGYYTVSPDYVVAVVTDDLPFLKIQIEEYLQQIVS